MANTDVQIQIHFYAQREPFAALVGAPNIGEFFRVFFTFFRRFAHVELSFPPEFVDSLGPLDGLKIYDGPNGVSKNASRVAFTAAIAQPVYENGMLTTARGVVCSRRIFEHAKYTKVATVVSRPAAIFMFEFLAQQAGKSFVHTLSDTYLRPDPPTFQHWFCVQLVTAALQQTGMMHGLNPSEMTADDLFFRLHLYNTTVLIDDSHAVRRDPPV